jgi:hypothetical protein
MGGDGTSQAQRLRRRHADVTDGISHESEARRTMMPGVWRRIQVETALSQQSPCPIQLQLEGWRVLPQVMKRDQVEQQRQ